MSTCTLTYPTPALVTADSCGDLGETPPAFLLANAMALATEVHLHQLRKIAASSYLSHPMLTAGIVLKTGGTLRATTIALLHDVFEEGGPSALNLLRKRFSKSIVDAVISMTPPPTDLLLPWVPRKEQSLSRIRQACALDVDVACAFGADKAATLWELELDCQHLGDVAVFSRMKRPQEMLWYYQSCWQVLAASEINQSMLSLLGCHVQWLRQRVDAYLHKSRSTD